jgi:hypothetical protein
VVLGRAEGTAVILAEFGGLTAATPVTVGSLPDVGTVEFFPLAYALAPNGDTRQFVVRRQLADGTVVNVSQAADGTRYFLSDATKATITVDGRLTTTAAGEVLVTVVHAGRSAVASVTIAPAVVGPAVVGEAGGVFLNADGFGVVVGAGALPSGTNLQILTRTPQSLPFDPPAGFTFGGAFELKLGGAIAEGGLGVVARAPAGVAAGDLGFVFRLSEHLLPNGTTDLRWQYVDSMVVGADGIARSTSPPNPQVAMEGLILWSFASVPSVGFASIRLSIATAIGVAQARVAQVDFEPQSGQPFFAMPGLFADVFLPIRASGTAIARVFTPAGLSVSSSAGVEYNPGTVTTFRADLSSLPGEARGVRVDRAELKFEALADGSYAPVITLVGSNFDVDNPDNNQVRFFPGTTPAVPSPLEEGAAAMLHPTVLEVTSSTLRVVAPKGFLLAGAKVRVDRQVRDLVGVPGGDPLVVDGVVKGDLVNLSFGPRSYVVVANSGENTVTVIDTQLLGVVGDGIVARIPVGANPADVVVTPDGTRAFVTNLGDGSISVIDLVTLQEVDVNPALPGLQRIRLPRGAQPYYLALHPTLPIAVATDRASANTYWFLTGEDAAQVGVSDRATVFNVDPSGALLLTGLTGLDFSNDGSRLLVASPGRASFAGADNVSEAGRVFVIDTGMPVGWGISAVIASGTLFRDMAVISVLSTNPKPFGVTRSGLESQPFVAVAIRGSETTGYTLIRTNTPSPRIEFTKPTNLRGAEPQPPSTVLVRNDLNFQQQFFAGLFDINSAEAITFTPDGRYGFVLFNNTFQSGNLLRDPTTGRGGNIGVLINPFDARNARFIGATKEYPYGWPDELTIDPTGQYLLATFKGVNKVVAYDLAVLSIGLEMLFRFNPSAFAKPTSLTKVVPTLDALIGEILSSNAETYIGAHRPALFESGTTPAASTIGDFFFTPPTVALTDAAEVRRRAIDQFNEMRGLLASRPLVREIVTGRLPSGIASGPPLPPDLIMISARHDHVSHTEPDRVNIAYSITGKAPNALTVRIYRSADRVLNPDPLSGDTAFFTETITDPRLLTVGFHVATLKLPGELAAGPHFYIVALDPDDVVEEFSETNNTTDFQVLPLGLSAEFDGDPDADEFGRYIRGVELQNRFTLVLAPELVGKVTQVRGTLGSRTLRIVNDGPNFTFVEDMGTLDAGTTELTLEAFQGEVSLGRQTYKLFAYNKPLWVTSGTIGPVETKITFDPISKNYRLFRVENLLNALPFSAPSGSLLFDGSGFAVSFGMFVAFEYSLDGKAANQFTGPSWDLTLFGVHLPAPFSFFFPIPAGSSFTSLSDLLINLIPFGATGKSLAAQGDKIIDAFAKQGSARRLTGVDLLRPDGAGAQYELVRAKSRDDYLRNMQDNKRREYEERFGLFDDPLALRGTATDKYKKIESPKFSGSFKGFDIGQDLALKGGEGLTGTAEISAKLGIAWERVLTRALVWGVPVDARLKLAAELSGKLAFAMVYKPQPITGSSEMTLGVSLKPSLSADLELSAAVSFNAGFGALASVQAKFVAKGGISLTFDVPLTGESITSRPPGESITSRPPVFPVKVGLTLSGSVLGGIIPGTSTSITFNFFQADDVFDAKTYKYLQPPPEFDAIRNAKVPRVPPPDLGFGPITSSWSDTRDWPEGTLTFISTGPARSTLSGPSLSAPANGESISSAVDLGVVVGTRTVPSAWDRAGDTDFYRFRTAAKAVKDHELVLSAADGAALVLLNERGAQMVRVEVVSGKARMALNELPAGLYYVAVEAPLVGSALNYQLLIAAPAAVGVNLAAELVLPSEQAYVGQALLVEMRVTNVGVEASVPTQARLVWSRDLLLDAHDGNLANPGDLLVPALAPGATYSKQLLITLPAALRGVAYLGLAVDVRNEQPEASEDDNDSMREILISLPPDAMENNDTRSLATDLGGFNRTRTIRDLNLADYRDDDWFQFYLSTTGTAGDVITVRRVDGTGHVFLELVDLQGRRLSNAAALRQDIFGNGVDTLSLEGLPPGMYHLRVTTEDQEPVFYDLELAATVRSGADVVVLNVLAPQEVSPGLGTTAIVTVANYGSASVSGVQLRGLLSGVSGELVLGDTPALSTLAPGEVREVAIGFKVPNAAAAGQATLRVVARLAPGTSEQNGENNSAGATLMIGAPGDAREATEQALGYVDLGTVRGTLLITDGNLHSGADIDRFRFTLSGTGGAAHRIELVNGLPTGDADLYLFGPAGGDALRTALGSTTTETLSLEGLPAGTYTLMIVRRDPVAGGLPYSLSIAAPDVTGANLAFRLVEVPTQAVRAGDSLEVKFSLVNQGNAEAGPSSLRFELASRPEAGPGEITVLVSDMPIPAIAAGAEFSDTVTLTLPGDAAAGWKYIRVQADATATVAETIETDNRVLLPMAVQPNPDALESNNDRLTATALVLTAGHYQRAGLTLSEGDVDYFRLEAQRPTALGDVATFRFDPTEGDLAVALLDASGNVLRQTTSRAEELAFDLGGLRSGVYYLRVKTAGDRLVEFSSGYSLAVSLLAASVAGAGVTLPGGAGTGQSREGPARLSGAAEAGGGAGQTAGSSEASPREPELWPTIAFSQSSSVALAAALQALRNGTFGVSNPADPEFAWTLTGAGAVVNQAAQLWEGDRLYSRFEQSFLLPAGATTLRFTLLSTAFTATHAFPPDAFEVALLDAVTGAPVAGTVSGLAQTDALLNLQANGTVRFARGLTVNGVAASGDALPASGPITVTVDLRGLTGGQAARLVFDLIGFGPADSSITIDDVEVLTGPPLAFALDAASDSGAVGDDVTNLTPVTLVGTTNPGQQVRLDLDGDGFDDGLATADNQGRFSFAGIALAEGPNTIRMQANSAEGTTVTERVITLDRIAPKLLAVLINGGAAQRSMVSSISLQFSEDVRGSLSAADFALRNLTSGVPVDADTLQLSFGPDHTLLISFPTLPGASLPDGNYAAVLSAAGVTDAAGNALDANGDGASGGHLAFSFFRYFGDMDGDRDVDFLDLYQFQKTYLKGSTALEFNAALDFDGNGRVDAIDLEAFRVRYLSSLSAPAGAQSSNQPNDGTNRGDARPSGAPLAKAQAHGKVRVKLAVTTATASVPKANVSWTPPATDALSGQGTPWARFDAIFASARAGSHSQFDPEERWGLFQASAADR